MKTIPKNETPEQRMQRLDREASRNYVARRLSATADHVGWYKKSLEALNTLNQPASSPTK